MKHFLFPILLSFCGIMGLKGQTADNQLAQTINDSDWFLLDTKYSELKDSVQHDFVKVMTEALLAHYFNKPAEAIPLMRVLVNEHQGWIGSDAALAFSMMALYDIERCQDYVTAMTKAKALIEQIRNADASKDCTQLEDLYQRNKAFSPYASTVFERRQPKRNSVLPLTEERSDGQFSGYSVQVMKQGKSYRFLCSGAPFTCLSKKTAEDLGAISIGYGNYVYLDRLNVGDITFRHVIAQIATEDTSEGKKAVADAVMGMDLLQRLGEIQVDNVRKEMIIPVSPTPMPATGRNMCSDGVFYWLKADGRSVALADLLNRNMPDFRNLNKIIMNFDGMFIAYNK